MTATAEAYNSEGVSPVTQIIGQRSLCPILNRKGKE